MICATTPRTALHARDLIEESAQQEALTDQMRGPKPPLVQVADVVARIDQETEEALFACFFPFAGRRAMRAPAGAPPIDPRAFALGDQAQQKGQIQQTQSTRWHPTSCCKAGTTRHRLATRPTPDPRDKPGRSPRATPAESPDANRAFPYLQPSSPQRHNPSTRRCVRGATNGCELHRATASNLRAYRSPNRQCALWSSARRSPSCLTRPSVARTCQPQRWGGLRS